MEILIDYRCIITLNKDTKTNKTPTKIVNLKSTKSTPLLVLNELSPPPNKLPAEPRTCISITVINTTDKII